ncbi:tRNA (guanine-N(7)-)-methyltransferase (tRNA(m7G46)-methyltransferase) [Yamadazyma tenuis]|uniref:tRNA (guanine-N(7)-)-methyltransferase (tRNA(m7G46)-methyltransferase) n=1 Tax=Candida tenuis TaxID=2315449 RepID=UPI0027982D9E|nr:tRNA (guanine-N(7)-)-methyltransferase (tRNA(m7G46)-methyltransferase) [Yamadazyma tenuis]
MYLFFSGMAVMVGVILYHIFVFSPPRIPHKRATRRFKLLNIDLWQDEQVKLSVDPAEVNKPIVEEAFLISETLEDFISLIIQEFIDGWYTRITSDSLFQDSIRVELNQVFGQLKNRIVDIDLAKLLVSKLVPIVNDHLSDYIRAEERVQGKINSHKRSGDSIDHDIDVARHYRRGKIHPAVTVSKTGASNINEKDYLRAKVGSFLPYVLSEREKNNDIGLSLVREILACTVLANVFQMLGEGDFYNLLIVKLIGDNLKRRDQVKKLRAALDEHTQQKHDDETTKINKDYIVTENMDMVAYNNCLEKIGRLSSLDEAKQLRMYVSFQLLQLPSPSDSKLISRLREVQSLVETKIKELERTSGLGLLKVLHNTVYLDEFSKYLDENSRGVLLQFWLAVERIKAPLELTDDKLSLSLGFSNSNEIREIHQKYLHQIGASNDDLSVIEEYINSQDLINKSKLYQDARDRLFRLQESTYTKLEYDFKDFTTTDRYRDLVQSVSHSVNDSNVVSPTVIKAVEDAFTRIMKNNTDLDAAYESERQAQASELKRGLFGESSSLFQDTLNHNAQKYSKLFDDLSDESGTDSDSLNFDSDSNTNLQSSMELDADALGDDQQSLLLAAPGDLKLAEEIDKLTNDISVLNEQLTILDPLIKKAELTNNISEIKILKNSKASLEREISSKELQKQQYIVQENDNSLYGKSRVKISSYISGNENGNDFILYIIELQRFSNSDPNTNTAGWIIARRFSQFFKLHEYLRSRYPQVNNLKFPKRTVFKLQQKQIVELRRAALEEYLKELLEIPEVCSNRVFRSFLSSENFNVRKNQSFEETTKPKKNTVEALYQGISNRFVGTNKKPKASENIEENMSNLRDMERELKSFDEREVFIKPLINILMTVFKLKNAKSWLRGRALLVILQQVFGTTIEKKIYEQIAQIQQEESILDVLILLKNIVFPNGKFRDPPVIRSAVERYTTQEESRFLLSVFMSETFSTIFGVGNTKYAFSVVFNCLQNDFLVRHLVFELFDEIVDELFPELNQ